MEDISSRLVDLFGLVYRNLIRDEQDHVEVGPDSRSAILAVLYRRGPCSMTDLSRSLRVTKSNITFLVDKLEAQSLLMRQADPTDRRVVQIQLTAQGREQIEQQRVKVLSRIQEKLSSLNPEDRAYLEQTLPKVMGILSRLYAVESDQANDPR